MTEQEYIDTQALTSIRMARTILHNIIPESTSFISSRHYETVIQLLAKWESQGYEAVECEAVSDDSQH